MRFLILIYLLTVTECHGSSYNVHQPVGYFTNQSELIDKLKNSLESEGIANISGVRGSGKTELTKKYFEVYYNNYKFAGYFDGAISLTPQLIGFAEYINTNAKEDSKISLDPESIRDNLIKYLNQQKNWLLIFDNLPLNNNEVNNFVSLKDSGHIICISVNNQGKSNEVILNNLQIEHVKNLLGKIMKVPDQKLINELSETLVKKGSPTALIVDSAYFLNNHPHYTVKEYINKITNNNDLVKNYLELALDSLSLEAKKLLTKIALLNNQEISKNVIVNIVKNADEVNELLTELLNTNLLRMLNLDRNNPIFGLHDIYKDELLRLFDNKNDVIQELIISLNKTFPEQFKYGNEIRHIFLNDQTLAGNIEVLLRNIEKYNIKPTYNILELRLNALINAFELSFMSQAEGHIQWFKESFLNHNILPKTSNEKKLFSTFLIHLASSEFFIYMNSVKALEHLFLAKDIIKNEENNNDLKSYINIDIAQIQAYIGDLENSKKSITQAESLISYNSNAMIKVLFVKSLIYLMEGDYHKALSELTKEIELCKHLGYEEEWPAITGQKAKILNSLGRFEEAYIATYNLYYKNYPLLQNNDTDKCDILTQLSKAELGLRKLSTALEHAKIGAELLLSSNKRNNMALNLSTDIFLAEALVAYGDSLSNLNELARALEEYNKAERIYKNVYKNNFSKIDNVSYLVLQAAKVSYKSGHMFWYKHYSGLLKKILPMEHVRVQELDSYISSINPRPKL